MKTHTDNELLFSERASEPEPTYTWGIKVKLTDGSKVKFELAVGRSAYATDVVEEAMIHMEHTMGLDPARVVKYSCERSHGV